MTYRIPSFRNVFRPVIRLKPYAYFQHGRHLGKILICASHDSSCVPLFDLNQRDNELLNGKADVTDDTFAAADKGQAGRK